MGDHGRLRGKPAPMGTEPPVRQRPGISASLLAALVATACAPGEPELRVSPSIALVDEPIAVAAVGLDPSALVRLRATTLDQQQRPWTAEAAFMAGPAGRVDVARQPPEPGGSYQGVDAMGLFWSARPQVEGADIAHRPGVIYETRLELVLDGEVVDHATVTRRFDAPDLVRLDVDAGAVVGRYWRPAGRGPFPGVLVFAGSDGGLESAHGGPLSSRRAALRLSPSRSFAMKGVRTI